MNARLSAACLAQRSQQYSVTKREIMLWTICMVLIILWLLGMVTSYTMGGLIHILLAVAIIVVLVRVIQGRKVL